MINEIKIISLGEAALNIFDILDQRKNLYANGALCPTGISAIDEVTGGINPTEVMVVAGRPSMGKTSLMLQFAYSVASHGKRVLFLSCEMVVSSLVDRLISSVAEIEASKIKFGKLSAAEINEIALNIETEQFATKPLYLSYVPTLTLSLITQAIEKINPDVIFIDHIQLLCLEQKDNLANEISNAMYFLKRLAGEKNIGLVVGSQTTRAGENQLKEKSFTQSFLKGSGGIEEAADQVLELELAKGEKQESSDWQMILRIKKNKFGALTGAPLIFKRRFLKFMEINRNE